VPSVFGTIAGAGIPPPAASSPGIPSSAGESNAPPAQSGCRHPNISHPGSFWTAGVAFEGAVAPITPTPAIAAATAVLVSLPRSPDAITHLICRSLQRGSDSRLTFANLEPSEGIAAPTASRDRIGNLLAELQSTSYSVGAPFAFDGVFRAATCGIPGSGVCLPPPGQPCRAASSVSWVAPCAVTRTAAWRCRCWRGLR
jgi:hypothetical protein